MRVMNNSGLSLVEIMVAITIMVIIATIVGINVWPLVSKAGAKTARIQIAKFEQVLDLYQLDNRGSFPTTEEGLDAVTPYLKSKKIPKDPWGRPYIYELREEEGVQKPFIMSYGADKRPGGIESNKDITNEDE